MPGGKKKPKSKLKNNTVTIKYHEYLKFGSPRCSVSVDPLRIPVKRRGEQIRWVFRATAQKPFKSMATCKVQFQDPTPFSTSQLPDPSQMFGPGSGLPATSECASGEPNTSVLGDYKYNIIVYPSHPAISPPIVIDPLAEVWDDSPPGTDE